MLLEPEEFEENILKRAFSNTVGSGESRDFSGRGFLKQKYKTTCDHCVFKFLQCILWTAGPKFPRVLMKSIIRRRSSISLKRKKSGEVLRKGEMHYKQTP